MKRLLNIVLFFFILSNSFGTIHYVSTTGSNANAGTIGAPWLTFSYACSHSVNGDVITFIGSNSYTEPNQCILPVGVNVDFNSSTIHFTYFNTGFYQAALMLTSAEGTQGNQTLQNGFLDGVNWTSFQCILVRGRGYVTLLHLVITKFQVSGIHIGGKANGENTGVPPSIFSDSNKILNCKILDCNDRPIQAANSVSCGNITYEGQSNTIFQFDTCINIGKPQGHNGDNWSGIQGNNKGIQWLDCYSQKPRDEGNSFNCHIENWFDMGGCVVRRCTFVGGGNMFDWGYGSCRRYSYPLSWEVDHNYFMQTSQADSLPTYSLAVGNIALQFESSTNATYGPFPVFASGDVKIHDNYYKNIATPIQAVLNNNPNDTLRRIYVYNETYDNCGYANSNYSGMTYWHITNGSLIDSIFLYNRTMTTGSPGSSSGGDFFEHSTGNIKDVYLLNNIYKGIRGYGYVVFRGSLACDHFFDQNNIVWQNAFTNNPYYFGGTPVTTNFTILDTLKRDPLFVSNSLPDFHLAAGSPGIGTGLNPPNTYIGAYPPGTITPVINWPWAALTYPNGLGAGQLDAVAKDGVTTVTGTHAYSPGSGTVGNVPGISVNDVFTPNDPVTYSSVSKTVTITVNPQVVSLVMTNTSRQYTGSPLSPTLTATPNVSTSLTLDGVTGGKINAGNYAYFGNVTDPNSTATPVSGTFTITKASATINSNNITVNYDGLTHVPTYTTTPSGLTVTHHYSSGTAPSAIGSYTDTLRLSNANYSASDLVVTIDIVSNPALIFISDTIHTYNGSPQTVTVTCAYTYSLTGVPQTNTGVYQNVIATITQVGHTGADTAIMTILPKAAVLSWTKPANAPFGTLFSSLQLNAVADQPGTWVYNVVSGSKIPYGITNLIGTFTPSSSNYSGGTISTTIQTYSVNPFNCDNCRFYLTNKYFQKI